MFVATIYLIDRAYGGPEEGGWYYDCGTPSDEYANHTRGFSRERDAIKYANKLNETVCPTYNVGRRAISSVLSTGRYSAEVSEGQPKYYPSERPHYE